MHIPFPHSFVVLFIMWKVLHFLESPSRPFHLYFIRLSVLEPICYNIFMETSIFSNLVWQVLHIILSFKNILVILINSFIQMKFRIWYILPRSRGNWLYCISSPPGGWYTCSFLCIGPAQILLFLRSLLWPWYSGFPQSSLLRLLPISVRIIESKWFFLAILHVYSYLLNSITNSESVLNAYSGISRWTITPTNNSSLLGFFKLFFW